MAVQQVVVVSVVWLMVGCGGRLLLVLLLEG
jgi:hypothetical protein